MAKLARQLGLGAVVAISVSTMLGSGIFVLPGLAFLKTGPAVYFAYLAAGLSILPAALSKAEMATAMPSSGGTYVYLDRSFGPLVGTIVGLGLWLSLLLKSAFALVGFSAYLMVLADIPVKATALPLLFLIMALNIRGVLKVSQVQVAVVVVAVASLLVLAAASAVILFDADRMTPLAPNGLDGFLAAVAFVYVSYAGVTKITAIAEEVKRPERTIPAAMLISLLGVMSLYAVVTYVLAGSLDIAALGDIEILRPIHALAESLAGPSVGVAVAVLGVVTMTSMANAGVLAASRFPFAMGRDRLLPPRLSRLHKRFLTPVASIVVSGAIMAICIVTLDVEKLAKLASAFMITIFSLVNVALIVLRETKPAWYKPQYRAPLYPLLQVLGVLAGVVFLAVLGLVAVAAVVGMTLPGIGLYFFYGRRRTERRGVLGIRGPRRELLRASGERPRPAPPSSAAVVVALLGKERSPELLVEHAAALAGGGMVKVVAVVEIPEQTVLDAVPIDAHRESVERRVQATAEVQHLDLQFETIMSRDVIHTLHDITNDESCHWLVMEWAGRSRETFTFGNPLGWLKQHLSCNLATFNDAGVRYIRRILVLLEPGPHDALVAGTADDLARVHGAELMLARYLPGGASDEAIGAAREYLAELGGLCRSPVEITVVSGRNEADAVGQESAAHDLLVMAEEGRESVWRWLMRKSDRDRLTEATACSVLRLQTPQTETHEVIEHRPQRRGEMRHLSELLEESCVAVNLGETRKEALFEHIARSFAAAIEGADAGAIVAAMRERERTQNTAVGHGVALPHATLEAAGRTYLGVFVTAEPISYGAPDEKGVDVLFATIGPPWERQVHLGLLAMVARLVKQTELLTRLRAAWDADEALAAIEEAAAELEGGEPARPSA